MAATRSLGLAFATCAFLPLVAVAQGQQFRTLAKRSHPNNSKEQTYNVRLGDVDGDGDLDVVLATVATQSRLYLNDGNGNLTDATSSLPQGSLSATDIELGDVDKDGDLDMVVGTMKQTTRLWLNDGKGRFSDGTFGRMPTHQDNTYDIVLADMDLDRDLDLVLANYRGQNRLYLNNGQGTFTDATSRLPVATAKTYYVAVGRVGPDPFVDILFANDGTQNRVLIHNFGARKFVDETATRFPADTWRSFGVHMADVDGDGDQDVLFANYQAANNLYLNDGTGKFTDASSRLPHNIDKSYRLEPLDVDEDGDLDLIVVNYFGQNQVWLNNGSGGFTDVTAARMPVGSDATTGLALGDLDQDGDDDLFLANFGATNQVLFNHHRQIYATGTPSIGQVYNLELDSRPGYAGPAQSALPFLNLQALVPKVDVPPFGRLGVHPLGIVLLPVVSVPAPGGQVTVPVMLPNDTRLRGLTLHSQALLLQLPPGWRFTNTHADVIQ